MEQAIRNPFGVSAFGSAIVRVPPDTASVTFAVKRTEQHPRAAFQEVRNAAKAVQNYLAKAKLTDFGSSHVSLEPTFKYSGGEQRFVGYTAKVGFVVLLKELDRVEEITAGVIDAGVNDLQSVDFQTSRLKEIRADARRAAIEAAREKAELYCQAAGVSLGSVIHIEDVNPDTLRGREGHVKNEMQSDNEHGVSAFDPGCIVEGAAVIVGFTITS